MIKLGAPLFQDYVSPEEWVSLLKENGYGAAYAPISYERISQAGSYRRAASDAGIIISEVGSWSNPLSADEEERTEALSRCKNNLALAEELGARCCVNIAGSRGEKWDGPHPANLADETFDMVVDTVREIIDAVEPKETSYALEPMPWIFPHTADSYRDLLEAVDREAFAVHLDPVNVVSSPSKFYYNGELIGEWFQKLGDWVISCHAKDIVLRERLTVHLDEVVPGEGGLDYPRYLVEIDELDGDTPLMVEHLESEEDYERAVSHIRSVAEGEGVNISSA